jgi:outer membrane protein
MKNKMNDKNTRTVTALKALAMILGAIAALGASACASAQTAGSWAVGVGYNNISPQGTTDPLSAPSIPNSTTKVSNDGQPILTIDYMFTDHFSAEFGLGTQYTHKLSGAGALSGAGNLGSLKQLPPTLFAQYRFLEAASAFRPYVGLGLSYAIFRDEQGSGTLTAISNPGGPPTTFTVDNAWGVTPEVGLTYAFNSKWYGDVRVAKTFLSTTVHLSTGESAKAPLNPIATALVIGYRF